MAKKRKTREQKKLADQRHSFSHFQTVVIPNPSIELNIINAERVQPKPFIISQNNNQFLIKDLSKTALLTLGIIIFQLVLFALLKNHILVIPGLNY